MLIHLSDRRLFSAESIALTLSHGTQSPQREPDTTLSGGTLIDLSPLAPLQKAATLEKRAPLDRCGGRWIVRLTNYPLFHCYLPPPPPPPPPPHTLTRSPAPSCCILNQAMARCLSSLLSVVSLVAAYAV